MRLASVLVVLLILGGASVLVMDRVLEADGGTGRRATLADGLIPPALDGAQASGSAGPIDQAEVAACATEAGTIRQAEELYKILNGEYADAATLAADGNLREVPTYYDIVLAPDAQTYTLSPRPPCG